MVNLGYNWDILLLFAGGIDAAHHGIGPLFANRWPHKLSQKLQYVSPPPFVDRRRHVDRLSILSFNTCWLNSPSSPIYSDHRSSNIKGPWKDAASALAHMERVARLIEETDADLCVLSEVQDLRTLQELNTIIPCEIDYEEFLVDGMDRTHGLNVGVLSRITPTKDPYRIDLLKSLSKRSKTLRDKDVGVSRNIVIKYQLECSHGQSHDIALIGAHLRSCRPKSIRLKQAQIINQIANQLTFEGYKIIIAGDFNDVDHNTPGPGDDPSSDDAVLRTLKRSGCRLSNPLSSVPLNRRYTIQGGRVLDYVLVDSRLTVKAARIYNNEERGYHQVSDHFAVKVEVDFANDQV